MKAKNNQNGNILVIVLVLIAVVATGTITIMNRNKAGLQVQEQSNLRETADRIKATLIGAVTSPQSWQVIQKKNTTAFTTTSYTQSPTATNGGQLPTSQKALDIYLTDSDSPYYAATNPRAGFTVQGHPCSPKEVFNATTGSDECPLRYNIYLLSHVYSNGSWVDTLRFELLFRPKTLKLVLAEKDERYTFNLVRNVDENNVVATCKSLNGTYDDATKTCSVKLGKEVSCAHGKSYTGPKNEACATSVIYAKTCASGQAITGFDSQGNPICENVSN